MMSSQRGSLSLRGRWKTIFTKFIRKLESKIAFNYTTFYALTLSLLGLALEQIF